MDFLNFKHLFFAAEDNTNISTDLEPAITRDHIDRLTENIETLQAVLGITEMVPMASGSTVKRYKSTVTVGAQPADEGDIIPLSKVSRTELDPVTITLNKYRRLTTAEAIQRVGLELALNTSDDKLLAEVQRAIRDEFFTMLTAATATAGTAGTNFQTAIANAWAALSVYYEDKDAIGTVYFANPLDAAEYLGSHNITVEEVFGLQYVTNFLGLGTLFITPRVSQGSIYATVSENLNGVYIPQNGDVGQSFSLDSDESGLVGMTHSRADNTASIQTLILSGVTFYPEDAAGIVTTSITSV